MANSRILPPLFMVIQPIPYDIYDHLGSTAGCCHCQYTSAVTDPIMANFKELLGGRRSGVWVKIGDSAGSLLGGFLVLSIPGWWFGTFFPYIGNPNWRTPSFFRGVGIPPTSSFFQSTHVWQGKKIDPYPGNVKRGLFLRLLYQSLVSVVIVIDHCLGYPRIPLINYIINQSVNQSTNQSISQSINQSISRVYWSGVDTRCDCEIDVLSLEPIGDG